MGRRPKLPYEFDNYNPNAHRGHPLPHVTLFISALAWDHLRSLATQYGYVKPASQTARGVSTFLHYLANPAQTWSDTRPPELITLSQRLLDPANDPQRRRGAERTPTYLFDPSLPTAAPNARAKSRTSTSRLRLTPVQEDGLPGARHAVWWDPDLVSATDYLPRHMRALPTEDGFPTDYYAALALTWGIAPPHVRYLLPASPSRLASSAIEAIGHRHLTPALIFHNPRPPLHAYVRTHNPKEIDW
jgi:hypothetical protein